MSNNQEGQSLEKLRSRIDGLDTQLLKLLNERAKCVIKIGKIKHKGKNGGEGRKKKLHIPVHIAEVLVV